MLKMHYIQMYYLYVNNSLQTIMKYSRKVQVNFYMYLGYGPGSI
jgi:hypothetical protein